MNNKRLNIYLLLISFTLFLVGCYLLCSSIHRLFPDTDGIEGVELSSPMKEVEEKPEVKNPNIINIPVHPPTNLNGKTKKEILNARKGYVRTSIFSKQKYVPSEEVFGAIEDGKPWISNTNCVYKSNNKLNVRPPAEESRFINNPSALVMPEYPFNPFYCEYIPKDASFILYPKAVKYDVKEKIIYVDYRDLPYRANPPYHYYMLNGTNARDFGYKYAYIDTEKSTMTLDFVQEDNAGNHVQEFKNLIHVGGSCQHESGCNNGSPLQLEFSFRYYQNTHIPNKTIYIKLWKEEPSSPENKADITEIITIEK